MPLSSDAALRYRRWRRPASRRQSILPRLRQYLGQNDKAGSLVNGRGLHRSLDIVRKTLGQNEIATYHDDFPKLDHRIATSFWAQRHPRARLRSTGEFSNGTSGENYSGINSLKRGLAVLAGMTGLRCPAGHEFAFPVKGVAHDG